MWLLWLPAMRVSCAHCGAVACCSPLGYCPTTAWPLLALRNTVDPRDYFWLRPAPSFFFFSCCWWPLTPRQAVPLMVVSFRRGTSAYLGSSGAFCNYYGVRLSCTV